MNVPVTLVYMAGNVQTLSMDTPVHVKTDLAEKYARQVNDEERK